jgi:hypothetical protein
MPETKDWTWVLQRRCPECGLDTRSLARADIAAAISANAASWQRALSASADPAARPAPATWSPVEYACHVRDLLVLSGQRLGLMLGEHDPVFANWDQDEALRGYGELVPAEVVSEIAAAAAAAASRFAEVTPDQWLRRGRRSDGVPYTVETFGRNLVHEVVHHLYDVTGVRCSGPHHP